VPVGNLQYPLFKTQAASLGLRFERSFFFRRKMERDSHNRGRVRLQVSAQPSSSA